MSVETIAKSLVDEASTATRSPHILPLTLVLAFVARATFALTTDYVAHQDEIFEYLEPAHRLEFCHNRDASVVAIDRHQWTRHCRANYSKETSTCRLMLT